MKTLLVLSFIIPFIACRKEEPKPVVEPTPVVQPTPKIECAEGQVLRGVGPEGAFCKECVSGHWVACKD